MTWIRRLLIGDVIILPYPKTVWRICEATRLKQKYRWVAGPVGLLAASHFNDFVRVVCAANTAGVPMARLADLVECIEDVISLTLAEHSAVRALRVGRIRPEALKSKRDRARRQLAKIRPTWNLTAAETAAFEKAWNNRARQSLSANPFLFAAGSMDGRREWTLPDQRRVVDNLLRWLRSDAPGSKSPTLRRTK